MEPSRTLFLSSMESVRFGPVRRCRLLRRLTFETGKDCALVEISPPVVGQDFNLGSDIRQLLLSCRHEGASLSPPSEFPLFVHVGIMSDEAARSGQVIAHDDITTIAWAEPHPTEAAAKRMQFNRPAR